MANTWRNHKGQAVPTAYIPVIDKKKDRVARKIVKKALWYNNKIRDFKQDLLSSCDEIHNEILAKANIDQTDIKGNYTITSFDKSIKIEISVSEKIDFDERVELAQIKINEYIQSKTKDVDHDLLELINSAFSTSKGRLDTKRILGLFALKITAKKWLEAMDLIKLSISRNTSKRYVRMYEKNAEGVYVSIDLNFSSI